MKNQISFNQNNKSNYFYTVILPVMNEVDSLKQTIEIIEKNCGDSISSFIIVICDKTSDASIRLISEFENKNKKRYIKLKQTLPYLGGAIRSAFARVDGTHAIMMASDMETNPSDVKKMILLSKENPNSIITASRWIKGGGFNGYNPIKKILNYIFQFIFCKLFKVSLSDMTYGFRIFPSKLINEINWEELRHPFLFESILKPIRLQVPVIEIPSKWKARDKGESQNTFFRNFNYFKTGFKILMMKQSNILKEHLL